jgi:uncharacterized protein YbjT (DUF2867 family)
MAQHILIVGATGLIGQGVLKVALRDPEVTAITLLVRRPLAFSDPRVRIIEVSDFLGPELTPSVFDGVDACFHCAGSLPIGMAMDEYRALTVGMTEKIAAAFATANPSGRLLFISAMSVDANSRIPARKIKGDAELALSRFNVRSTSLRLGIVQPVLGEISPHHRRQRAYEMLAPLLGLGARFAPSVFTTTHAVGKAMLCISRMDSPPALIDNKGINWLGLGW